ncbi:MAG: DinB family protein [Calditrichaceae bacterium]
MRDSMVKSFQINTLVLDSLIKDLKVPDSLLRTGQSNTIGWILGHILASRGSMLSLLKTNYEKTENEEQYKRGSEKKDHIKIDPVKAMALFKERGKQIEEALMHADESVLDEEITYKLPGGGSRVKDAIHFSAWHETFHIGQIDLILAASGKGGIK